MAATNINDTTQKVINNKQNIDIRAIEAFEKQFPISELVYLYIEGSLSEGELHELENIYNENNETVVVRDVSYAISCLKKITSGEMAMPTEYQLTDEFPKPSSE
jgi:hypothetical protein